MQLRTNWNTQVNHAKIWCQPPQRRVLREFSATSIKLLQSSFSGRYLYQSSSLFRNLVLTNYGWQYSVPGSADSWMPLSVYRMPYHLSPLLQSLGKVSGAKNCRFVSLLPIFIVADTIASVRGNLCFADFIISNYFTLCILP